MSADTPGNPDPPQQAVKAPQPSRIPRTIGIGITAFWIVGLAIYWRCNPGKFGGLDPNELGDFLAGAFAPLAFLWLVLGFFQQGEELRYSGQALWLQGRELQNSVEQQRELVKATRDALQFDSDRLQQEREDIARRTRPVLTLSQGMNRPGGPGTRLYEFVITNHGSPCTAVEARIDGASRAQESLLPTGGRFSFHETLAQGGIGIITLTVHYLDAQSIPGSCEFRVSGQHPFHIEKVE